MSSAASTWQNHVYRRISHRFRLQVEDQEDIRLLKVKADKLRDLRKKLLRIKFD